MRTFTFVQLDVFTDTPLQGNQLAVFTDARGLTDAEMQSLAKENNFSESTFVLPRDAVTEEREGVQVRIFTPEEELPFAGHPTLGTATYLRGKSGAKLVELALKVGKIPVTFRDEANGLAFGEMRQNDPRFVERHAAKDVARIAGLRAADVRTDVPIETVTTGNPFVIVPLTGLEAMQRLRFDQKAAAEYLRGTNGKFIYFLCLETADPEAQAHARMVFSNGEDPATGSAAGPAIAWLVQHGLVASGKQIVIEQGVEMGRRSRLYVRATKSGDGISDVFVGGYAIEVARGEYRLP